MIPELPDYLQFWALMVLTSVVYIPGTSQEAQGVERSQRGGGKMIMMMLAFQVATRINSPVLGIVIPLLVFGISFLVTWLLYRHFPSRVNATHNLLFH